ncbi:glycosyltransferase family 2 protein [Antricoccus suffuscus]|uniref:glycosyltransferase family 2 protein n=1 Tax=Antricoccus suffuscus TaxID=1629062 RepID=UPI001473EFBD
MTRPSRGEIINDSPSLAVVTTTLNRADLLEELYESLRVQSDTDFTWYVVDDGSADRTKLFIQHLSRTATFPIRLLANKSTIGKCASLNRVFSEANTDICVVVDSDDTITPEAVRLMKAAVSASEQDESIGAIFFRYVDPELKLIGPTLPHEDIRLSRARHDETFGKYDGCVGYLRRVYSAIGYPEYPGERYLGPTVLQLLMEPKWKMWFTNTVVGVAVYRAGGLTAQGRALRVKNPRSMMKYTQLQFQQASSLQSRLKYGAMYFAYRRFCGQRLRSELRGYPLERLLGRGMGLALSTYWRYRIRSKYGGVG